MSIDTICHLKVSEEEYVIILMNTVKALVKFAFIVCKTLSVLEICLSDEALLHLHWVSSVFISGDYWRADFGSWLR